MPSKPDSRLQSVEDALSRMIALVTVLAAEQVPLPAALGRVLAAPVLAARDQPPFDASAMDGYALRSADTPGRLHVIGESAAGQGFGAECGAGAAVRISTGAAVPAGADTIVIQEDARRDRDQVGVAFIAPSVWIRPRGGDFRAGAVMLKPGRRLDGIALALAAACGANALSVAKAPRVAILCSGDELAAPGAEPGPWQIFDSATHGVAALARSWGAIVDQLAVTRDDPDAIARAAEQALRENDLLVVIGGASVGDHDHARPALMKLGLSLAVEKVAVRPGKPTWFGKTGFGPVLGLPGNPASALVCAHLFLRPLMEAMQGLAASVRLVRARLEQDLPPNGARAHYLRSRLETGGDGVLTVRAFEQQDSSLLSVFAAANALIRLPPDAPASRAGTSVDVLPLEAP